MAAVAVAADRSPTNQGSIAGGAWESPKKAGSFGLWSDLERDVDAALGQLPGAQPQVPDAHQADIQKPAVPDAPQTDKTKTHFIYVQQQYKCSQPNTRAPQSGIAGRSCRP